jgi:hypothetical protein
MNTFGLKDKSEYRVSGTIGLENVGPILIFLANFRHDRNIPKIARYNEQHNATDRLTKNNQTKQANK